MMAKSPLCDGKGLARAMESAFLSMWERYSLKIQIRQYRIMTSSHTPELLRQQAGNYLTVSAVFLSHKS